MSGMNTKELFSPIHGPGSASKEVDTLFIFNDNEKGNLTI